MTNTMKYCLKCRALTPHIYGVICEFCAKEDDRKIDEWLAKLRRHPPEVSDEE